MRKIIKREYFLLSLIIFFGFLVRLYGINNPVADWHSWRQADTASVIRSYEDTGINLLMPTYHDISSIQTGIFNPKGYRFVEFPIYNAISAFLTKNFPLFSLEIWGRLVSIFFSLVSCYFIYLLGKRVISVAGGLWAAFFFAFIPYNIYFSRVILPEPMGVFFGVSSLWFFIKFIDDNSYRDLYLAAVLFALALLIKPFFIFYGIPMVYFTLKKYGLKGAFQNVKLVAAFDVALAPFFLWRIWVNQYPAGIPFFTWAFNGDHIRFRPAFWRWIFAERLGNLILGIWGLVPFSIGLLTKAKNLFSKLLILGMLLYVTIVATANVRHDYYQILTIPAVALIFAEGAVFLWTNKAFNRVFSRIVLVFSVLIMLLVGGYQAKEFYKINHPEIIAAGAALDKIAPKNALVIAPYNGDTAFLYQTKRWGWPAIDDSIPNIVAKGASYYVTVSFNDDDTKYVVSHYKVIEKTDQFLIADLTAPLKTK